MHTRPSSLTLACGITLLLGYLLVSTPAAAAGSACKLDLVMTQGGERVVHSDCIESTGAPEAQVTGLCGDLETMSKACTASGGRWND